MNTTTPLPIAGANHTTTSYLSAVEARRPLINVLLAVELFSCLLMSPISAYVARVMCTTSILNFNLRLLFVWQSVAGLLFAAGKTHSCVMSLLAADADFPYKLPVPTKFLIRFGAAADILLTPVLVLERITATRHVENYEYSAKRQHGLHAIMLAVLVAIAIAVWRDIVGHLSPMRQAINPVSALFYLLSILGGCIAYVVLLLMLHHSERCYTEDLHRRNTHSLSERYQNIHHCAFVYIAYSGAIRGPLDFLTYASFTGLCSTCLLMAVQICVIMFHPILRRDTHLELRRLRHQLCSCAQCTNRVAARRIRLSTNTINPTAYDSNVTRTTRGEHPMERAIRCNLKTIGGHQLIPENHKNHGMQAEYFKHLEEFWALHSPPEVD